jgi:hypothetical protein
MEFTKDILRLNLYKNAMFCIVLITNTTKISYICDIIY